MMLFNFVIMLYYIYLCWCHIFDISSVDIFVYALCLVFVYVLHITSETDGGKYHITLSLVCLINRQKGKEN